jgi:Xaa-Pro aminopeptidase
VLGELVDANRVPFLTRDPSSIRYLTGLVSSHALLVLAVDRITLITDGRYQEQAYATGLEVIIGRDLIAAARPVVAHRNDMILGIHDEDGCTDASVLDEQVKHPWTAINPILRLRGPVATGYGRGGKKLGVPTANVSDS